MCRDLGLDFYSTNTKALDGSFKERPEDFVVTEFIGPKTIEKGNYVLIRVWKKNHSTDEVVKIISRKYGISGKRLSYAGKKDKFAETTQFFSVSLKGLDRKTKARIKNFSEKTLMVSRVGFVKRALRLGDVLRNRFSIKIYLRNVEGKDLEKTILDLTKELRKGVYNYFDFQRFGFPFLTNHLIGEKIAKNKFGEAVSLILETNIGKKTRKKLLETKKLDVLPKWLLVFYLHAYQSFLWNKKLNETIQRKEFSKKDLKKERIFVESIRVDKLRLTANKLERPALVFPLNLKIKKTEKNNEKNKKPSLVLDFELPRGSYATLFVREVLKENYCKYINSFKQPT